MEDLREVGQKAIESVNKLRSSDAGDLVLGIGEIIEELREQPELYQEKLDHLEGLFKEFTCGEGYQLRNNRADILEEENANNPPIHGWSGLYTYSSYSPGLGYNAVSGLVIASGWNMSGTLPSNSFSSVAGIPPVTPHLDHPDHPDQKARRELEVAESLHPTSSPKPKKFKKRWWKTKAKSNDLPEEFIDD